MNVEQTPDWHTNRRWDESTQIIHFKKLMITKRSIQLSKCYGSAGDKRDNYDVYFTGQSLEPGVTIIQKWLPCFLELFKENCCITSHNHTVGLGGCPRSYIHILTNLLCQIPLKNTCLAARVMCNVKFWAMDTGDQIYLLGEHLATWQIPFLIMLIKKHN